MSDSKIRSLLEHPRMQEGFSQAEKAWDLIVGAIENPKGFLATEVERETEEKEVRARTVVEIDGGVTVENTPGRVKVVTSGSKVATRDLRFCTGCGARLIISHRFCGSCGEKVEA